MDKNAPPNYKPLNGDQEAMADHLENRYGRLGIIHFIKTGIVLFVGSVGFLMMVVLCVGVPPAMITIGIIYVNSCPLQPYIPIYLIVGGLFSMLSVLLGIAVRVRNPNREPHHINKADMVLMAVSNLVHCFTIAWFIAGCTWVYSVYEPPYDDTATYCDKTVYLFSFWLLNSVFIVLSMLLLLGLFMIITSLVTGNESR